MKNLLLAEYSNTIWALEPNYLAKMSAVLLNWQAGIQPSAETRAAIRADIQTRNLKRQTAVNASGGGIAVLPLYGVITHRGNMASEVSGPGGVSTLKFSQALRAALSDPSVGQILIDIDSPGGSVAGAPELADEIYQGRSVKPIIAVANSLAASAAYWIGASCTEFYCTPSGQVGSIGVYTTHTDMSKALEKDGLSMTLVSAGKHKTEGNPYGPLSRDAVAAIQRDIDAYYAMFTKGVSRGRGVSIASVREGMGQGRCLLAGSALAEKMIDGIATFDAVVAKMQRKPAKNNLRSGNIYDQPRKVASKTTLQNKRPSFRIQKLALSLL
jgi:signal peptide peptidase SppA